MDKILSKAFVFMIWEATGLSTNYWCKKNEKRTTKKEEQRTKKEEEKEEQRTKKETQKEEQRTQKAEK